MTSPLRTPGTVVETVAVPHRHGQIEAVHGTTHVDVNVLTEDPAVPHRYLLHGDRPLERWPCSAIGRTAAIADLTSLRAHRRAWRSLGIRLVRASATGPDRFAYCDVPSTAVVDVGDDSDDSDGDDVDVDAPSNPNLHGYVSDDGFVVPDDAVDAVPFTVADPASSSFVRDTHDAVRAYRDAVPVTAAQRRFRTWMDRFEAKYTHRDDNVHFQRGTAAPTYTYPTTRSTTRRSTDGTATDGTATDGTAAADRKAKRRRTRR